MGFWGFGVIENPRLMQERDWVGAADYSTDKIELLPRSEVYAVSDAKLEQTFCHELTHFLIYHSGGAASALDKPGVYLHQDEEFIDLLASLIHQVFSTMEYE